MKKISLLLLMMIFIMSCAKSFENNLVFYEDFPGSRVWIGATEISIKSMQAPSERAKYPRIFFDNITKKLLVCIRKLDNSCFFIADITNGMYIQEREKTLIPPNNEQPVLLYAYNNKVLIEYSLKNGWYGIVDLETSKQKILDIRDKFEIICENLKIYNHELHILGFNGELILFNKGYYNLMEKKFYEYDKNLSFSYYDTSEQKLFGIDEKNNIITEYEIKTGNYKEIKLRRNEISLKNFCDFYVEDGYFYIAKVSFLSNFNFISQPPQREWFKYSINTGKKIKVNSPTNYARILGRIGNAQAPDTKFPDKFLSNKKTFTFYTNNGILPQEPEVGVVE